MFATTDQTASLPFAAFMDFSGTPSKPSEHYENMLQLCPSEPPIPVFFHLGAAFPLESFFLLASGDGKALPRKYKN